MVVRNGKTTIEVEQKMKLELETIIRWIESTGLCLVAHKTDVIIFVLFITRQRYSFSIWKAADYSALFQST